MTGVQTVAEQLGVSYRQLDYWIRAGYVHSLREKTGSGNPRTLDDREIVVVQKMIRLIRAGFTVESAAIAARRMAFDEVSVTTLPGGVTIMMEDQGGGTTEAQAMQEEDPQWIEAD